MFTQISRPVSRLILTAAAMRAAEDRAIARGTSVEALMARAGAGIAEAVFRFGGGEVLILCGPGNNGGDGYVAAQRLAERGVAVRVAASGEAKTPAAKAARAGWGGPVEPLVEAKPAPLLVDALFGTGLTRPLDAAIAEPLQRLAAAAKHRIAVDLPSGAATDDGRLLGEVPRFDLTIALGALKPSHRLLPAVEHCGRIVVADIGLGAIASDLVEMAPPALPRPGFESNKYRRGKVVVIAGAMAGAAHLAAAAAQAAGAGYVELAGSDPSPRPAALVRRDWAPAVLDDKRIGAIVCGPGLGRDRDARGKLDAALHAAAPKVIDADALTLIGRSGLYRLKGELVLTPHWGEFTRLFGDDGRDPLSQARAAAVKAKAVVLLKGAMTIVAHPDGRAAIAPPAPAWLASAGTGDVLAGIVGALLAGGMAPFAAAQAAVGLHAHAARIAGPFLIADDLVAALPQAAAAAL